MDREPVVETEVAEDECLREEETSFLPEDPPFGSTPIVSLYAFTPVAMAVPAAESMVKYSGTGGLPVKMPLGAGLILAGTLVALLSRHRRTN